MSSLVGIVRVYASSIQNGRTPSSTLDHLRGEVEELQAEISNGGIGKDGIVGEAIDVIACALDIIFQQEPDIEEDHLNQMMIYKCQKWADKYSENDNE